MAFRSSSSAIVAAPAPAPVPAYAYRRCAGTSPGANSGDGPPARLALAAGLPEDLRLALLPGDGHRLRRLHRLLRQLGDEIAVDHALAAAAADELADVAQPHAGVHLGELHSIAARAMRLDVDPLEAQLFPR